MNQRNGSKQRNYAIDFWKLIFCLLVLLYHSAYYAKEGEYSLFLGGYIGVEFFAIISGYLMVASAVKKNSTAIEAEEIGVFQFIIRKIKSYMPYWIIFWIADFLVIYGRSGIKEIISKWILSLWSLGFLNMAGIGQSVLGMGWYIQSMLLVIWILYPICIKNWKRYCERIAPVFAIITIAYFAQTYHDVSRVSQWLTFFYTGTLRIFASMNLGGVAYGISVRLKKLEYTKIERIIVTLVENLGFVMSIIITNYKWRSEYDFLILFLFFFCITLQFSEISYSNCIFRAKWLKKAGKYSLLIYLASNVIKDFLIQREWKFGYWKITFIYFGMTIIFAFIVDIVWEWIRRKYE